MPSIYDNIQANRVRDPARVEEVVEALKSFWKRCPHLSLTQVLTNVATWEPPEGVDRTPFREIEDNELLWKLQNYMAVPDSIPEDWRSTLTPNWVVQ